MAEPMEISSSSEALDLHSIRSRINELSEIHRIDKNKDEGEALSLDSEKLLKDCSLHFESKVKQIIEEYSDVGFLGIEDLDEYLAHLKEELNQVEAESAKISNEIEDLSRNHIEESNILEGNLEGLKYALDSIASQGMERVEEDPCLDSSMNDEDQSNLMHSNEEQKFEIMELESQIEKNNIILKSLQDLDSMFKRLDTLEQIEDALTGLKVIGFDGNCIRLSLQTYIPKLEGLLCQKTIEDISEPSEMNHELLVEIVDGTMEIKNVEMFPNDVYLGDIIDDAKSFRQLSSNLMVQQTQSSLEWFVGKVQDRIILSTLRRFIVKSTNKSRHSFEYLERDETIVAHLVGGIDAFIKLSQGWPLSKSPLKLLSIKSSDHHSRGISLSLLCKAEEMANSLDMHIRQNLSAFVDAVEKLLLEQMRLDLQSDDASD
ncbi:PREDICTED: uncharacterized protein LOC18602676 isoform X1 [Theobroma cacao]|uniref:Uncharacterized protein LOC18602676 isoform X1 n=1 Tax=Theobroma cacao TaxID=3641 RepID=A0AB32VBD3_THECC|nr:PREDICTED: uncharacterized protein LOC18602676 isoform X1 [Theobroma cacao]XP_017974982.1 PREDICTED: uncharacterized protein LOC18602676 isoform X1 [Theobroma cacao]XP_017974983.1 PREDICTED: uncharacterized protein LOC18602676 isoform X1 [Theobroma cacao]